MIDKNFYLENLSAFDILIEDEDRKEAEKVIFRVFSMLQRDKIWLRDIATEEEIFEEDAELLAEVEQELKELDEKYEFRFDEFYKLVQQEMKKIQSTSNKNLVEDNDFDEDDDTFDDEDEDELDDFNEDFEIEDEDEDLYDEDEEDEENDALSHLSDEEIDLVPEYILASAKTRFNYPEFLASFPVADEEFVEEQFLFPVIAGKAFGETDTEIAENMHSTFMTLGYQIEMSDLMKMIEQKGKELGLEILAFKVASDSLRQGARPTAVVEQISQLLKP
ncbi:hypothetical protein [Kaistella flava (ex Peng et al. 2021)]|uniref:hypothetical protein n=1 Tax=Kaistella flava (ex Peng et al. 2021) TaxID=2038776 RepID=UPI00187E7E7E|nr:hypothetical protein [Kaistella flava (ex Peng et al. 2021)]